MTRRARTRGGGREVDIAIDSLGGRGDGVGRLDARPVFVPFVLPGERVRVRITGERDGAWRGEMVEVLEAAPERVAAPCPYFGQCGGCSLQHLADAAYRDWQRGQVLQALQRRGLGDVPVAPLVSVPPGTRRRAVLAAVQSGGGVRLGFHEARSHAVVDVTQCLILHPGLMMLLAPLRAALQTLLNAGERATVTLTLSDNGPDVLVSTPRAPALAARESLAAFAEQQDLARVSWHPAGGASELKPEPIAERRRPVVRFSNVPVAVPPGAFLQPTAEGEAILVQAILERLPEAAARVADLYAGCGPFTFALAERARVYAAEGDAAALGALDAATRQAGLAGRIEAACRDLARRPLTADELARFDCVVFDPPRAGARTQAEQLAASRVPAAIAVSCNPQTFARDARILVDGGFDLVEVAPLDQFPWSAHLELVALFRR